MSKPLAPPPDWLPPYEPDGRRDSTQIESLYATALADSRAYCRAGNATLRARAEASFQAWQVELDRVAEAHRWPR
jgi:hypothetical protein